MKFNVGDKVTLIGDDSGQVRTVLARLEDLDRVIYKVSSVEVNVKKKALVEGVMHVSENELELHIEN